MTIDGERMCEIGQEIWAQQGRWEAGEGRARRGGGRVRAALEALLRRMEGLHRYERMYEGWLTIV